MRSPRERNLFAELRDQLTDEVERRFEETYGAVEAHFAEVASSGDIWPLIQQHIGLIIAWVIINALLSALQLAIMQAPFAAAYRDIKGVATV